MVENHQLDLLRTVDESTWDIRANDITIGKRSLSADGRVRFEPQLPYLYLPGDYYKVLVDEINGLHGETICKKD